MHIPRLVSAFAASCLLVISGLSAPAATAPATSGVVAAASWSSASGLEVSDLTVQGLVAPLGVDVEQPTFGWTASSNAQGASVSGAQVVVSNVGGDVVWDSERVEGEGLDRLKFAGDLQPKTRYTWKVRLFDGEGDPAAWSPAEQFGTGAVGESDWSGATWIANKQWLDAGGRADQLVLKPVTVQFDGGPVTTKTLTLDITRLGPAAAGETGYRAQIAELEARNGDQGMNVALGATVTAPSTIDNYGWNRSFLVDGKTSSNDSTARGYTSATYTSGDIAASPIIVTVTFPSPQTVDRITLYPRSDLKTSSGRSAGFPTAFSVRTDAPEGGSTSEPGPIVGSYDVVEPPPFAETTRLTLPRFRSEFTLPDKKVVWASLYVSGLGGYEAEVNGNRAGDVRITSGMTKFDKRTYYDAIDVTDQVHAGNNAIAIGLGQNWLNGIHDLGFSDRRDAWNGILRTRALLEVQFEDGSRESIPTSSSWKSALGPFLPLNAPLRNPREGFPDSEGYDARLEQPGWSQPGFNDAAWVAATPTDNGDAVLQSAPIEPNKVVDEVEPVAVTRPDSTTYVYDFGRNISAVAETTLDLPDGHVVEYNYAERLANGRPELAGARYQRDKVTGNGSPFTWTGTFTYKGFRYLEIKNIPAGSPAPKVKALRMHNNLTSVGTFESDSSTLNWLHGATRETLLNNMVQGVPTDGSYIEKLPWLGDAHLIMDAYVRNFDSQLVFEKWFNDIADSQGTNGDLPAWAPAPTGATMHRSSAWSYAFPQAAIQLMNYYGSDAVIEARYAELKKFADFEWSQFGSERESWGDWECPSHSTTGCRNAQNTRLATKVFSYGSVNNFSEIAKRLGHDLDAAVFADRAQTMAADFNNRYFDAASTTYTAGGAYWQTNNVLPLAFGLVPKASRQAVADSIAADVVSRGNHLNTGVLGTKHLFRVLTEYGHVDTALAAVDNPTAPSYASWKARGATTLWEQWLGKSRSEGHPFFGSVLDWMYQDVAGLVDPGLSSDMVVVKPYVPEGLERASTSVATSGGKSGSSWTVTDGKLRLTVDIPVSRTGTVSVPVSDHQRVLEPKGAVLKETSDGYATFTVPSGRYVFKVKEWVCCTDR